MRKCQGSNYFKKMTVIFDHTKIVEQNDDYGRPSCKKRLPGRAVIVLRFKKTCKILVIKTSFSLDRAFV